MNYTQKALLFSALLLAGCASSGPEKLTQSDYEITFPIPADRDPSLDGVWFHADYALLLEFDKSELTIYNRIGNLCWPEVAPELNTGLRTWLTEYSILSDNSALYFRASKSSPVLEFKAQTELPAECSVTYDRQAVVDAFTAIFDKYYGSFAQRGVKWKERQRKVAAESVSLTDDAALLKTLQQLVEGLVDPGLAIKSPGGWWRDPKADGLTKMRLREGFARQNVIPDFDDYERRWYSAVRERVGSSILQGPSFTSANGAMIWGSTETGTGYVQLQSLVTDGDWQSSILEMLKYMEKRPALILDVSIAEAGDASVARMLASALLGKDHVLYTGRPYTNGDGDWIEFRSESRRKPYGQPIFVLISDQTAGAAEYLALALNGNAGVTLVGTPSRGAMAEPIMKSLPNGWLVRLGTVVIADRGNVSYEGIGIAPDFALTLYPEGQLSQGHYQAVTTLNDLIAEGHFGDSY